MEKNVTSQRSRSQLNPPPAKGELEGVCFFPSPQPFRLSSRPKPSPARGEGEENKPPPSPPLQEGGKIGKDLSSSQHADQLKKNKDSLLLKNIGRLLTMSATSTDKLGTIDDAAVLVEDGRFSWVGREADLPSAFKKFRSYDLDKKFVTPGLIDCHTHLVHAGSRENEYEMRSRGMSYWDIAKSGGGILSTVKATNDLSEEELYKISLKRLDEAISNGITTIEMKTGYGLNVECELKIAKVISQLAKRSPALIKSTFLGLHVLPKEYKDRKSEYLRLMVDEVMPRLVKLDLISACDIFVEKNAFDAEDARYLAKCASSLGLDLHLHVDQFSDLSGGSLAAELKALSADHLEHASKKSVCAMARAGVVAVVLPGATFFTSSKTNPPVREMLDAGVDVAISTDYNPGTSPTLNLLLMATMAVSNFGMTCDEVWKGITINAAKALKLDRFVGSIEVGKRADLVIFNAENEFFPLYAFGRNNISNVMIEGRIIKNLGGAVSTPEV